MPPEKPVMTSAASRSQVAESSGPGTVDGSAASGLRDLFAPLDDLLTCGGDPRLALDRASRLNAYGCGPAPSPETWQFGSSTASTISERAYARADLAREHLMGAAIAVGLDEAFDARIEEMRADLRACLRLAPDVGIVFSPSGTDSQLHALFLARTALGARLTTVVVGADQSGSGTRYTARGRHFAELTARGRAVCQDGPIPGLSCDAVALPLFGAASDVEPNADADSAVLQAIANAVAGGSAVLLHIMDCSKLGWRAPSEACLDEIARRWPHHVRIAVDACQMRLSRARIRNHLGRGHMVLVTGSKFFGGPAFSGALLVPAGLSPSRGNGEDIAAALYDYASRSDWPQAWALRSRFSSRPNLGQWLRWEAALEEIKAYYRLPAAFRKSALAELQAGIERVMALSPSIRPVTSGASAGRGDGDEFGCPTIFPFMIRRHGQAMSADDCRAVYRALASDLGDTMGARGRDREIAGRRCLVGQPVRIHGEDAQPTAVLRLCVGARQVIDAWSPDAGVAQHNLQCELDRVAGVAAKIELLLEHSADHPGGTKPMELLHGV
jgi:hypothetical protein